MISRRAMLQSGLAITLAPHLPVPQASAQSRRTDLPPAGADGWISLINGRDLTGWYTMLQKSGKGVAEKRHMVTVESEMLHIMGADVNDGGFEPGYMATDREFENVRIRVEYRWGQKQFGQRAIAKRDNGLLYGLVGEDKVWPRCVECQIEEGDTGDVYLVDGIRGIQASHGNGLFGINVSQAHGWPAAAPPRTPTAQPAPAPVTGRMIKDGEFEDRKGWNTVEVLWQGDRATHIVNGRSVNTVTNLQQPDPAKPGEYLPLTRGKIALEIEYAEIWFRRVEVKAFE